jgi:hypothetical protein
VPIQTPPRFMRKQTGAKPISSDNERKRKGAKKRKDSPSHHPEMIFLANLCVSSRLCV